MQTSCGHRFNSSCVSNSLFACTLSSPTVRLLHLQHPRRLALTLKSSGGICVPLSLSHQQRCGVKSVLNKQDAESSPSRIPGDNHNKRDTDGNPIPSGRLYSLEDGEDKIEKKIWPQLTPIIRRNIQYRSRPVSEDKQESESESESELEAPPKRYLANYYMVLRAPFTCDPADGIVHIERLTEYCKYQFCEPGVPHIKFIAEIEPDGEIVRNRVYETVFYSYDVYDLPGSLTKLSVADPALLLNANFAVSHQNQKQSTPLKLLTLVGGWCESLPKERLVYHIMLDVVEAGVARRYYAAVLSDPINSNYKNLMYWRAADIHTLDMELLGI